MSTSDELGVGDGKLPSISFREIVLATSSGSHIGLLCVQDNPNARPLMSSIVSILENGDTSLPPPKQPIYFAERNHGTDGAAEAIANSANTMSVTALEGR